MPEETKNSAAPETGAPISGGPDSREDLKEKKPEPSYEMENPISQLAMEHILRVAGHLTWLIGAIGCIAFLWNTNQQDATLNWLIALGGFLFLAVSLIFSVTLFGLSEILRRVIRIQRKVRAFVNDFQAGK
jgi:hypothetical protein